MLRNQILPTTTAGLRRCRCFTSQAFFFLNLGLQSPYLLICFGDVLVDILQQIDPFLVALRGQSPKEGTRANLIELHKIIIHKALIYVLDCLENNSALCTKFLDFFQVKDFLFLVIDTKDSLSLFLQ